MTDKEKMSILEECMDLDEGTLNLDDTLADFEEWDSLAALSLIASIGENFGKTIDAADIKKLVTVADALKLME